MTPKQRLFAEAYVNNGGQAIPAAREAGYTDRYAKSKSYNLLEVPDVIAEIKRIRERMNQRADKTATDVVNEFSKIAFVDRVGFLKEDPHYPDEFIYKSPDELTDEQRAIVETVKTHTSKIVIVDDDGTRTLFRQEYNYVLSDKSKALENMGRHFGIFDDKLKLGVSQSNPFATVTQEQLEKLKATWVQTMNEPIPIEGQCEEVKK